MEMTTIGAAIYKDIAQNEYLNKPVSYTHLDVYKRQLYPYSDGKKPKQLAKSV